MAVKAVCVMTDVLRNSSTHTHFDAAIEIAVTAEASTTHIAITVEDLDPSALGTTLTDTIQSAVKDYLTAHSVVTFGLLDTVRLLPGLV